MKITNGKILICTGIAHSLLGLSNFGFGKQFRGFMDTWFFKISDGLLEFPLLHGQMNYENFAAFWFFYFGVVIIPMGIAVNHIEKTTRKIPNTFIWGYLIMILMGVYMIPLSGMTFFMLPHAVYMIIQRGKT
ncbi:DUF6463 family protein [Aquimarina sp. D1M17]|uniref:DUF6463 family protein n=1 Tax=Aquimarina acroporae TaxID=2937283 RepID=UPI0020BDE1EC|nr:DUF6463 family protein [Aquimarina acroporae]MCK8521553.1 DUF6463 family protein [Aquimarina acroporae]